MQKFDRPFVACKQTIMNNIINSFGNLLQNNMTVKALCEACKIVMFNSYLMPDNLMNFSTNWHENLTSAYFNEWSYSYSSFLENQLQRTQTGPAQVFFTRTGLHSPLLSRTRPTYTCLLWREITELIYRLNLLNLNETYTKYCICKH